MPTYKNNLHLGIKDPLVDTDSIADGSITTDKIADGAITEPKLAEAVRKLLHFRELRFLRSWKTQLPPTAPEGDYALAPMGNVVYFKEGRWLGEQFDRTILYIDCTKGRFFHYDNGRLIELSTERQLKTINGEPIYGEGDIQIGEQGQISIDTELDEASGNAVANRPVATAIQNLSVGLQELNQTVSQFTIDNVLDENSTNPVANRAIKNAIDNVENIVAELTSSVSDIADSFPVGAAALLPFNGSLSQGGVSPQQSSYSGEGGDILYDGANNRMLLKVDNKYYISWSRNGLRPASSAYHNQETLKLKSNIFLWRIEDGSLHICKPTNGILVEVASSTGGSITVDPELNPNSQNPVENQAIAEALNQKQDVIPNVAQRLENSEDNITALFQMLKALDDKVKSYHPEPEPDPEDPVPFDPSVGNVGTVVINTDPEDITASDVENALTLTPLADDLPVGMKIYEVAAEGSGQTADVYFKPGNTSAAKTYNTNLLAELCKATGDYADCAGLHLDQVYYIKRDAWVSSLSAALVDNGIPIEKDFIIDGEVNGVATGGFSTTSHFFYTRHSLNLNKAVFETTNNQGYYAFCIDAVLGIDQVIVTGCKFLTSSTAGKHFTFVARDQSPLDQDGILVENNCVGDVLFQDNEFEGANTIFQGWSKRSSYFRTYTQDEEDGQGNTIPALQNNVANVLFKNSFRFIGNTVGNALTTPMVGMGVSLGTANENAGEYDTLKAYTSCPLWMAGNTFQGKKGLARASSSGYYTALLAEFSKVYFLHNSISDLIAAQNVYDYTNNKGVTTRTSAAYYVYDLYASVTQLFCCNNTYTNLAKLTNDHTYFGITKGKGVCVPGRYTAEHMPVERLYFGNEYTVNQQEITAYWNQRTYPESAGAYDYTPMIAYDNTVNINNVLSIKFTSGAWSIPIETFLFKQNTINAPLLETISNDGYGAEHFIFEDNEFNTPAVKDDVHDFLFTPESCKEILFKHNTFDAIPSSRKFFFIEYQQSAGRPTITFADNNTFPQGVTHVIARFFCRTTSQYENVEVSINGKYNPYAAEPDASTTPVI